jgi:hypothetical protein
VWDAAKRYSEFVELNTAVKSKQKVTAILPPKKVFGNFSLSVIKKRQEGLLMYLKHLQGEITAGKSYFIAFLNFPKAVCSQILPDEAGSDFETSAAHKVFSKGADSICSSEDVHDARGHIVDNVSNQMIDVYLEPLQLRGRDAIARQHQYFAAVSSCELPCPDAAGMEEHVKSILFSIPRMSGETNVAWDIWDIRLKNSALSDEEIVTIRKAARAMHEGVASLEPFLLPSFVVAFSEQHSISPALLISSSQRS